MEAVPPPAQVSSVSGSDPGPPGSSTGEILGAGGCTARAFYKLDLAASVAEAVSRLNHEMPIVAGLLRGDHAGRLLRRVPSLGPPPGTTHSESGTLVVLGKASVGGCRPVGRQRFT
jgi:hypothetical protein